MTRPPRARRAIVRQATVDDMPGIWSVRLSVDENTLSPGSIGDDQLARSLDTEGRGWVAEEHGEIVGFAIGLASGRLWALFVHPGAQGLGIGSRLHERVLAWFGSRQVRTLWPSTGAHTRARRFYEARGWRHAGPLDDGEVRLERNNPG